MCFKEVLRVFTESFKGVSRQFKGCFKMHLRMEFDSGVGPTCLMKFCCATCFAWISSQLPKQKEGLFIKLREGIEKRFPAKSL